MDTANAQEALREVQLDVEEGADMLMVKPAHSYLDVIYRVKQAYPYMPLSAYHTSGEYCMLKAAAEKGWIDERKAALEVLKGYGELELILLLHIMPKNLSRISGYKNKKQ